MSERKEESTLPKAGAEPAQDRVPYEPPQVQSIRLSDEAAESLT